MSFFNNSEFLKFSTNQNNTLLSDLTNKPKVQTIINKIELFKNVFYTVYTNFIFELIKSCTNMWARLLGLR